MASLLIIGGTGFFGKSILDSFKRGLLVDYNITKVFVLARNTNKFTLAYPELCFNDVDLINGDISNINELPNADYIIHAATSTNMNDYLEGSNLNFENGMVVNASKATTQATNLIYSGCKLICNKLAMGAPQINKQLTTSAVTIIIEKLLVWYIFSSFSLDPNRK